ncbi:hypothetical protein GBAR_LOCUS14287 [Geodia barretti]|uniref:Death domain-containing protein n=1 Tax=Geodia barretti TaxID=519541 RepID=A0AA35WKA3_GEOBA|nr:hypothetical protein GBAR_LOCUS14287 [Geodia barretti]
MLAWTVSLTSSPTAQTRDLTFNLGVDLRDLDNVDEERRGADRTKYYMQTWLSNNPYASWKSIVEALKDMRLNRQATQLAEMLSAGPTAEHAVSCPSSLSVLSASHGSPGQPTLPQLLRLKVPQRVGVHASNFGIFLLDDTLGSAVRNIEAKCRGDYEAAVKEILQQWLQGKGIPVTWENLISTLSDIDLNVLASEINDYVKSV